MAVRFRVLGRLCPSNPAVGCICAESVCGGTTEAKRSVGSTSGGGLCWLELGFAPVPALFERHARDDYRGAADRSSGAGAWRADLVECERGRGSRSSSAAVNQSGRRIIGICIVESDARLHRVPFSGGRHHRFPSGCLRRARGVGGDGDSKKFQKGGCPACIYHLGNGFGSE